MSKAKMEAARELIREKRYSEARAILRTVDHPTARTWLIKLDEIDPPKPITDEDPFGPPVMTPKRKRRRLPIWAAVLIFLILIGIGAFAWTSYNATLAPASTAVKQVLDDMKYRGDYCLMYCSASKDNTCIDSCWKTPVWYMRGTKTPPAGN